MFHRRGDGLGAASVGMLQLNPSCRAMTGRAGEALAMPADIDHEVAQVPAHGSYVPRVGRGFTSAWSHHGSVARRA